MPQRFPRAPIRPQPGRREVTDRINRAFESSDIDEIRHAIGAAIRLYNISDIAKASGLERASIYRAFEGDAKHPNFRTVLSVLDAMGFQLMSRCAGMLAPDWRARKPFRAATSRKDTNRRAATWQREYPLSY
jgi:probable addiction module antidote protein